MDSRETSQLVLDWHDRQVVAPENGELSLGKFVQSNLTLPGEFTCHRHAHIERQKQYYVLVDHSTNGTFLNDEQVEPSRYVELLHKDVLRFGFSDRLYVLVKDEEAKQPSRA